MGAASSTGLSGRSDVLISLENKKDIDLNTILDTLKISTGIDWSFGIGDNQINCLFHDKDSTDETGKTIAVNAGATIKNAFGDVITLDALKLLYVKNTHETLTLEVLGMATTAIPILADPADIIEIPPLGFMLWVAPLTGLDVTTNENLKFASKTAGTITFEYAIAGLD